MPPKNPQVAAKKQAARKAKKLAKKAAERDESSTSMLVEEELPSDYESFVELTEEMEIKDMLIQLNKNTRNTESRLRRDINGVRTDLANMGVRVTRVEGQVAEIKERHEAMLKDFGKQIAELQSWRRGGMIGMGRCPDASSEREEQMKKIKNAVRKTGEEVDQLKNCVVIGRIPPATRGSKSNEGPSATPRAPGAQDVQEGTGAFDAEAFFADVKNYIKGLDLGQECDLSKRARNGTVLVAKFEDGERFDGAYYALKLLQKRVEIREKLDAWVQADCPAHARVIHSRAQKFAFKCKAVLGKSFRFVDGYLLVGEMVVGPEQLIPPEGLGWELLIKKIHDVMKGPYRVYDVLSDPLDRCPPGLLAFLFDYRDMPESFVVP